MPVSTEIQYNTILQALMERPHTTTELRDLNVLSPAPRILELRQMGFDIETTRATFFDSDGDAHTVGLYSYFRSGKLTDKGEHLLESMEKRKRA